jgi:hypothetical protein
MDSGVRSEKEEINKGGCQTGIVQKLDWTGNTFTRNLTWQMHMGKLLLEQIVQRILTDI